MKKMLSVIMVGILMFSLAGCGGNNVDSGKDSAAANENTVSQETAGAKENASLPASENAADESGQPESGSSMAEQDRRRGKRREKQGKCPIICQNSDKKCRKDGLLWHTPRKNRISKPQAAQ